MAEIDRMLEANQEWATRFPGSKPVKPARAVAVVACMDSRMPLFGLRRLPDPDEHLALILGLDARIAPRRAARASKRLSVRIPVSAG